MDLKNKNQEAQTSATFLAPIEYVWSSTTSSTLDQKRLNSSGYVRGIDQTVLNKIETDLKLTFLSEKDEDSLVCMANSPEVRDDFKDVFDFKDLRDYIFAVSQSPNINIKQKDSSEIKTFEVPYPKTTDQFWKLVNLGSQLRNLKLQDSDQKTTAILNETAKLTSD